MLHDKRAGRLWKCEGSELVAVMRRTPGKAQEFAKQVPGGRCVGYENLEAFLQHPGLDAVYVATRPGTHLEICKAVAAACKIVYVEKPVGRCAVETASFLKAVGADKLYTAYISRAYPRTEAVRRLLKEGAIGDRITSVSYVLSGNGGARDMDGPMPWRLDPAQSGGGLIMDVGCHVLDRIDWLCGPIEGRSGTNGAGNWSRRLRTVRGSATTGGLDTTASVEKRLRQLRVGFCVGAGSR